MMKKTKKKNKEYHSNKNSHEVIRCQFKKKKCILQTVKKFLRHQKNAD